MNEAFKRELSEAIQKGGDARKLLERQGEVIADIKGRIALKMATASVKKTSKTTRFLFWTITSESLEGINELERLAAELTVITEYEDTLKAMVSQGEVAKMNLETLNER